MLVAAGRGERLGDDRPKAFARLGELPLLAEPLRRLDESEWIDGDRRRRPAGVGGAGDPARRGARRDEGDRLRARRRRPAPRRCGPGSPRCPTTPAVILVHDAARPLLPPELVPRLLEALAEGFDGAVPGAAGRRTRSSACATGSSSRRPRATSSSRCRRRRRSSPTCCAPRPQARAPTAPRSSRRPAGGSRSSPGDERLLKVTTPADLERGSHGWLEVDAARNDQKAGWRHSRFGG